ncbi:putative phage tail assembly chaperone [Desulfovibrio desulfuricans]|uniref:putative phage tail assembly chaperone n=1 Tax=Desulfovibrio desulfuricans TaxID=876 RepID=UPI0003B517AD|nr:putative phage tail assembly chaperone [Desulfovibrio desulfuricans]
MNKTVTLTINGKILRFNVTPEVYNKYIDEIQSTKKVGPTRNALMRTVHAEDKETLKGLIDLPGAAMQIWSQVVEEYAPDLTITVGE